MNFHVSSAARVKSPERDADVGRPLSSFGKVGHAEVLGLVGQVGGDAFVFEDIVSLKAAVTGGLLAPGCPVEIFSQTTKSPSEYAEICGYLSTVIPEGKLTVHDTICSQVATRHEKLSHFAQTHDVVIFVSGNASSNGRVLCEWCRSVNLRTYHIGSETEINREWFCENDRVGVCGATSTPRWLLEKGADAPVRPADQILPYLHIAVQASMLPVHTDLLPICIGSIPQIWSVKGFLAFAEAHPALPSLGWLRI